MICPQCGSPDIREVLRVEVRDQGYGRYTDVEYVDRRCQDCGTFVDIDLVGGV